MDRPERRRLSPGLITAVVAVAVLLGGFGLLADEVLEGDTLSFDNAVIAMFREPGNPADPLGPVWVEEAVRDITSLGSFSVLGLLVAAVVIYLAIDGKGREAVFVAFAVLTGTAISTGLKMLFDRPRPDFASAAEVFTASFPSGHATVSAVVYLTLGALLAEANTRPVLKAYFLVVSIILTVIVGISRIYLGVHFPTDVIGGWALGGAWALLCWVGWRAMPR